MNSRVHFARGSDSQACVGGVRRGGRYPQWAHTGAVSASLRLRCDARAGVAPRNSLHSLRSLRSNNRGGSEVGARALRAPTPALRFSPPHKSPTPGTAHRAERLVVFDKVLGVSAKPWVGVRRQRHEAALRNAGLVVARASALRPSDPSRLFERSERSERSEFRDGPRGRVPEGSRPAGTTAASERRRTPARGFASPQTTQAAGACRQRASRKSARWSH